MPSSLQRAVAAAALLLNVFLPPAGAQQPTGRPPQYDDRGNAYRSTATTYVPLDSWVYPAFDRLAALGLLDSDISGLKPWTRRECLRLVQEAAAAEVRAGHSAGASGELIAALRREFEPDLLELEVVHPVGRMEQVYVRVLGAGGSPRDDGFHFGQTLTNDLGRPLRRGGNTVAGLAVSSRFRALSIYLSGEHRYSGTADPLPLAARQAIANADVLPLDPGAPIARRNEFRPLDSYALYSTENWGLSLGWQSLRWGHQQAGSLSFSENAEPVPMLRLARTSPMRLPFLPFMGPIRFEGFIGRLSGHRHVFVEGTLYSTPLERQPLVQGGRFGFKPTPNLEFGFGVTTTFGGPLYPLTFGNLGRSLSISNEIPGFGNDPGDRRSSFDLKYRLPGLRKWLTFYNESMAEDEFSSIAYPRRSAMAPGLYLSRVPGVERLDVRAEGFYTDIPNDRRSGAFFFNGRYRSGFTNRGALLGHIVGRQGSGIQLQSTYWESATNKYSFIYRDTRISDVFIAQGGNARSFGLHVDRMLHLRSIPGDSPLRRMHLSGILQYERWNIPVLSPRRESNFVIGGRIALLR